MTCDTAFRARGCLPSKGVEGLSTASICSNRKVSRPGVWTGDNESHGRNSELDHRAPRQREGSPALDQAPPRAPPLEPGRLHQARAPHAATGRRRRPAPEGWHPARGLARSCSVACREGPSGEDVGGAWGPSRPALAPPAVGLRGAPFLCLSPRRQTGQDPNLPPKRMGKLWIALSKRCSNSRMLHLRVMFV